MCRTVIGLLIQPCLRDVPLPTGLHLSQEAEAEVVGAFDKEAGRVRSAVGHRRRGGRVPRAGGRRQGELSIVAGGLPERPVAHGRAGAGLAFGSADATRRKTPRRGPHQKVAGAVAPLDPCSWQERGRRRFLGGALREERRRGGEDGSDGGACQG